MRGLLLALVAGIVAAFAGWAVQQFAGVIDPSIGGMARNCIGIATFAGVLVACLIAATLQKLEG